MLLLGLCALWREARGCSKAFHVLSRVLCALSLVLSKKGCCLWLLLACFTSHSPELSRIDSIQFASPPLNLYSGCGHRRKWNWGFSLCSSRCSSLPSSLFFSPQATHLPPTNLRAFSGPAASTPQTPQGLVSWMVFSYPILDPPCPLALWDVALYKAYACHSSSYVWWPLMPRLEAPSWVRDHLAFMAVTLGSEGICTQ